MSLLCIKETRYFSAMELSETIREMKLNGNYLAEGTGLFMMVTVMIVACHENRAVFKV